jgi:aquaporin Z
MPDRLRHHWPEYLMEAAGLGLFMIVAAACASVIEHPASPLRQLLPDPLVRRALMGVAMGATSIALVYSPMGARSGAHLNPATTLTFYRLGRVHGVDAAAYIVAQFVGGVSGIAVASRVLSPWIAAPPKPSCAYAGCMPCNAPSSLTTPPLTASSTVASEHNSHDLDPAL